MVGDQQRGTRPGETLYRPCEVRGAKTSSVEKAVQSPRSYYSVARYFCRAHVNSVVVSTLALLVIDDLGSCAVVRGLHRCPPQLRDWDTLSFWDRPFRRRVRCLLHYPFVVPNPIPVVQLNGARHR